MDGGEHGKRVVICFVFILFWVQTGDQFNTETCLLFAELYRHSGRFFSYGSFVPSLCMFQVRLNQSWKAGLILIDGIVYLAVI